MFFESPQGNSSLVMNIHALCEIVWHHNAAVCSHNGNIATALSATPSPSRVTLNGMFHQDSSTQWSKLRIWKICNAKYIKLIRQEPSQFRLYIICVIKARMHGCVWNDSETHSPVMQSSNTVSCVSLSFRTRPWVLAIYNKQGHTKVPLQNW